MAVHYKLKSSRKFESVFFEGHEITGRELKAEIAAKQVTSTPSPGRPLSVAHPTAPCWLVAWSCSRVYRPVDQ